MKNCPNCGAAYSLETTECPYCGSLYFNMECIDFTESKPVFLRLKIPYMNGNAYTTICAIPRLDGIEMSTDTQDLVSSNGLTITSYVTNRNLSANISFQGVPFGKNNSLMEVKIKE